MIKTWTDDAWADYMYWHDQNDKRTIKRINQLIQAIDRDPYKASENLSHLDMR